MPDFNKGDFTQQGVNGHVNATVRLNEKRLVNIDLTSNEEEEGCTITGQITDLLNNIVYPLTEVPGLYDFLGKDTVLVNEFHKTINLRTDTTWSSWISGTPSSTATDITNYNTIIFDGSQNPAEAGYDYLGIVIQTFTPAYTDELTSYKLITGRYLSSQLLRYIYGTASEFEAHNKRTRGLTILQPQGFQYFLANNGNPTLGSNSTVVRPVGCSNYYYSVSNGGFNLYGGHVQARTESAYFPATTAAKVDRANTNVVIDAYLFKTPTGNSTLEWLYDMLTDVEVPE